MEVLQTLSAPDREALLLVAWDGLKIKDAAAVMGFTTAAFSVRLHRVRKRFIKRMALAEDRLGTDLMPAGPRRADEI
ncbi:MAG: RNA polymerase sigma factor [Actinomycetota bacterium]